MADNRVTDITTSMAQELNLPLSWIGWFQVLTTLLAGSYSSIPSNDKFQSNIVKVVTKSTTGNPSYGYDGLMCINTFDNTLKVYGDSAWRTIASW